GGAPDFKEDDIALAKWFTNQLKDLDIPVHLNTTVSKDMVLSSKCDTVIIATGSTPKVFSLGDNAKVYTASEVLLGSKDAGETTVVVGGGLVGCETALWLAKQGKKVTIVEALHKILAVNGPLCHANSEMLEKLIPFNHIDVITDAKVNKFENGQLKMTTSDGEKEITCDSVILSVGYQEQNSLYYDL
ncbi:2-enoate reductase, partial [Lachnotalea glycerini]